jgi:hypothetical protein
MWFEAPGARFVKLLELLNITIFSSSYTTLQVYATEYMGICLIFHTFSLYINIYVQSY